MPETSGNRSVDILVKKITNDSLLTDRVKQDPIKTLNSVADDVKREYPAAHEDKFTFRIAVIVLSIVILAVVGLIGYTYIEKQDALKVPEILVALGSTALGALAGLLAPSGAARSR